MARHEARDNMTSSTKPEVHNIVTLPEEGRATATVNAQEIWWLSHVVFEICERTDTHTDTLITIPSRPPGTK